MVVAREEGEMSLLDRTSDLNCNHVHSHQSPTQQGTSNMFQNFLANINEIGKLRVQNKHTRKENYKSQTKVTKKYQPINRSPSHHPKRSSGPSSVSSV